MNSQIGQISKKIDINKNVIHKNNHTKKENFFEKKKFLFFSKQQEYYINIKDPKQEKMTKKINSGNPPNKNMNHP